MRALFWLAAFTLGFAVVGGIEVALGSRRIRYLRDLPASPQATPLPGVSIVVAARNEAEGIAEALGSLLAQTGVEIEVVLVNDRSEDDTGRIARGIAAADPRLRVIDLHDLPSGWLGKNHAQHVGARTARHEWLLFTDADVVMAQGAVARAVGFARAEGLDHLAISPQLRMPSPLTDLFGGTFVLFFARYAKPWKARDPRSRHAIGIGAFNLVRRESYMAIGGHSRIPLRPDDDMALGKVLKRAGMKQDVLYGTGEVVVQWYPTLSAAVHGLEKNAFTGLGYSALAVIASSLAILVFGAWPWVALLATSGPTQWLNAGTVAITTALYVGSTRSSGASPWYALGFPFGCVLFCYIIVRAAALAIVRGEVRWRGTRYSLEDLRSNRI